MKDWKEIGELFREIRMKKGYTVMQIQQMLRDSYGLEISTKTIYSWETNHSHPSVEVFLAVCDIYDLRNIGVFLQKNSYESELDITREDEYLLHEYHANDRHARYNRRAIQDMIKMPRELRSY